MINELIYVLDQNTALKKNVDLFYLEMPLKKSGVWLADLQVDAPFNGTGLREYNIYYRGKSKSALISNIQYLKSTIDNLDVCNVGGQIFRLTMPFSWEYLEKDAEGYFVFANVVRFV